MNRMVIAIVFVLLAPMTAFAPDADGWATWTKLPDPIFEGQYIASDPTVLIEDDGYRMFCTCYRVPEGPFDPETVRAGGNLCRNLGRWTFVDRGSLVRSDDTWAGSFGTRR